MKFIYVLFALSFLYSACGEQNHTKDNNKKISKNSNVITKEKTPKWEILFDGRNLDAWELYGGGDINEQWKINNDVLVFTPIKGNHSDIVTKKEYTNFELSLEWKISEGGNSGIFWGVKDIPKYKKPYQTGAEIQILDNQNHPDAKVDITHQAGALYDLIAPNEDVTKPVGKWNTCFIKVDHHKNEGFVILNNKKIVTFPLHGTAWDNMVKDSKFKDWIGFATYKTGKIGLQDHNDKVSFRNIKIKAL